MRQTTKIRRTDVDQAAKQLDDAPDVEPEEVTRKEAIRILAPKIKPMRRKGYSWQKVAEILTKAGIPIEAELLVTYVREASETPSGRARRTRRASSDGASAGATPAAGQARSGSVVATEQGAGKPPVAAGVGRQAEAGNQVGRAPGQK